MKALFLIVVFFCSSFVLAQAKTEGQFLDPSCNCVREPAKNAPLDADLVRKMEEEARAGAGKKLLAQVKSYRCPRAPKKDKDDVNLGAYGISDDEEEGPALSDVMESLIAKAGIDENHLEGDVRSRAEDSLEKKIEKCRKSRAKNVANRRNDSTNNSSAMNIQMMQMMMAMRMQSGQNMNYGMNYGMSNNGLMSAGYNPYLMGTTMPMTTGYSTYNPYAMLANSSGMSLASLSPAQQVMYGTTNFGTSTYAWPSMNWPMNSIYGVRPLSSR